MFLQLRAAFCSFLGNVGIKRASHHTFSLHTFYKAENAEGWLASKSGHHWASQNRKS